MGPGQDRTRNPGSAVRLESVARHVTYCPKWPGIKLVLILENSVDPDEICSISSRASLFAKKTI